MRIRRVTAGAFAHLRDETLELAEGLTVVYGPNESGKSTWHAALLAALCGRWPNPNARDEPGIERRRPWPRRGPGGQSSGRELGWAAGAEILLDDGRRVEVRQDLGARLGTATDLVLGRDVAPEITGPRGGGPDATRWLRLDRTAFVATACVRQSHLVLATAEARGIRAYVERAASTAAADETAAAALARIAAFQQEHVGTERSRTRPLQVAERAVAVSEQDLRERRERQAELDRRSAAARELRVAAEVARLRLARHDAARAWTEAGRLRQRASDAEHLAADPALADAAVAVAAGIGGAGVGAAPAAVRSVAAATEVAPTEVAAALAAWRAVPRSVPAPTVPRSAATPASVAGRRRSAVLLAAAAVLLVATVPAFLAGWTIAAAALAVAGAAVGAVGFLVWGRSTPVAGAAPGGSAPEDELRHTWARAREEAAARVLGVAAQLGLPTGSTDDAVVVLDAWLAEDRARQSARESARDDATARRERLRVLLEGGSLADVREQADRAQRRAQAAADEVQEAARRAAQALRPGDVHSADIHGADVHSGYVHSGFSRDDAMSTVDDAAAVDVEELRREHREAERLAGRAEQTVADLESGLARSTVAEAEERVEAAWAELARLQSLDDVLSRTRQHLERAQEQVHRDIAPRLAAALARDLAAVTAGRYTEALVDPHSLVVKVRGTGAEWREVETLSVGTMEQVYLLLRVALAEHLVAPGESCPLLLDDVTVHADRDRTGRILDVLLAVAQRHQVVLFTQQEQVRQWARDNLDGSRHALCELTTLAPV